MPPRCCCVFWYPCCLFAYRSLASGGCPPDNSRTASYPQYCHSQTWFWIRRSDNHRIWKKRDMPSIVGMRLYLLFRGSLAALPRPMPQSRTCLPQPPPFLRWRQLCIGPYGYLVLHRRLWLYHILPKTFAWSHRETGIFPGSLASVPGHIQPPTCRHALFHPDYGWCSWSVSASRPYHRSRGPISTLYALIFLALGLGGSDGGWGYRPSVHFPPSYISRRAMILTPSCSQSSPSYIPDRRALFFLSTASPILQLLSLPFYP